MGACYHCVHALPEMLRAGTTWLWREAVADLLCGSHLTSEEQEANLCPWLIVLERLFWKVLPSLCIVCIVNKKGKCCLMF